MIESQEEILVGYQGEFGSNSYFAAVEFMEDAARIALVCSERVVKELEEGNIQYGVVAIENSSGGIVEETRQALLGKEDLFEVEEEIALPIHHAIFLPKGETKESVKRFVSHAQALKQTTIYRKENFPQAEEQEEADTALAARKLAEGKYPKGTAVVCTEYVGEYYGLQKLADHVENDPKNTTVFRVLKKVGF